MRWPSVRVQSLTAPGLCPGDAALIQEVSAGHAGLGEPATLRGAAVGEEIG